jgi:hypothetical protein
MLKNQICQLKNKNANHLDTLKIVYAKPKGKNSWIHIQERTNSGKIKSFLKIAKTQHNDYLNQDTEVIGMKTLTQQL